MKAKLFTKKRRAKAFGLIEVLIAIAISAMIMLGAVSVSIRGLRLVRENELQDLSSGILLRSLEISRSPISFNLIGLMGTSNRKYFTLEQNSEGKFSMVEKQALEEISECSERSEYRVEISNDTSNKLVCNQIQVSKLSSSDIRQTFEVRSIVVYNILGKNVSQELISYRTEIVTQN